MAEQVSPLNLSSCSHLLCPRKLKPGIFASFRLGFTSLAASLRTRLLYVLLSVRLLFHNQKKTSHSIKPASLTCRLKHLAAGWGRGDGRCPHGDPFVSSVPHSSRKQRCLGRPNTSSWETVLPVSLTESPGYVSKAVCMGQGLETQKQWPLSRANDRVTQPPGSWRQCLPLPTGQAQ